LSPAACGWPSQTGDNSPISKIEAMEY
jgi:hypothetical protein